MQLVVEASWNVMAHAQKPDFVFRRNERVYSNQRGRQFSRLLAAEVCASPCSEVVWNCTGYPLHSLVCPSLPLPCFAVCHHISTGVTVQIGKYLFDVLVYPFKSGLKIRWRFVTISFQLWSTVAFIKLVLFSCPPPHTHTQTLYRRCHLW